MNEKANIGLSTGDKVVATKRLSWTIGEFDEHPLVVEPGDVGTLEELIDTEHGRQVYIAWEKDTSPHLRKCLSERLARSLERTS